MSQTINDAADGLKAIGDAISGASIRFYAEPEEKPGGADVTAEVDFSNLVMVNPAALSYDVDVVVEFATPSNLKDWSSAIRRLRDFLSPFGSKSFIAAINANPTLGGKVEFCQLRSGGLQLATRKRFADGDRWTQELYLRVRLAA